MGEGYEQVNNDGYGTLAEQMAVPGFGLPCPGGADPEVQISGGVNLGNAWWLPLRPAKPRPVPEHRGGTRSDGYGGGCLEGAGSSAAAAGRLGRAAAAGATAVALSRDRDPNAALGRRDLHQDRADIAYVQVGALAEADAAVPARRLTFPLAQLPALMQLTADGRV